jgi:hypothetical protein
MVLLPPQRRTALNSSSHRPSCRYVPPAPSRKVRGACLRLRVCRCAELVHRALRRRHTLRICIGQSRAEKNVEGRGLTCGVAGDIVWHLMSRSQHEVRPWGFSSRNSLLPCVPDPTLRAARRDHHNQRPGGEIGEPEIVRCRGVGGEDAAPRLVGQIATICPFLAPSCCVTPRCHAANETAGSDQR